MSLLDDNSSTEMFLIQYIVEGVTKSLYIHCRINGEANDIIVSVLEEVLLHEGN
jgi:hypothetical protein